MEGSGRVTITTALRRPSAAQLHYTNHRVFRRYERWDEENPQFYPMFCRFTLDLIQRGRDRISAAWIFERIRWESMLQTSDKDFKLNNDFRAIYARRFMFDYPHHTGVFELRGPEVVSC